jgi:hypothetical protein
MSQPIIKTYLTGNIRINGKDVNNEQNNLTAVKSAPAISLNTISVNTEGTSDYFAKSDHTHYIESGNVITQYANHVNSEGNSTSFAKSDHIHNIPSGMPVAVSNENFMGLRNNFALSDHKHQGVHSLIFESNDTNNVQKYGDIYIKQNNGIILDVNNNTCKIGTNIETYIITDTKNIGTHAGTFINNTWITRTLNKIKSYNDSIIIENNQIIINPGIYKLYATIPAYRVGSHSARLYDITNSEVHSEGTAEYSMNEIQTRSIIDTIISIENVTIYEIQHRAQNNISSYGLGFATGFQNEVYTTISIIKLR